MRRRERQAQQVGGALQAFVRHTTPVEHLLELARAKPRALEHPPRIEPDLRDEGQRLRKAWLPQGSRHNKGSGRGKEEGEAAAIEKGHAARGLCQMREVLRHQPALA